MNRGRLRPANLILEVIEFTDDANARAQGLLGGDRVLIAPLSLPAPPLEPPELGFLRAVAWLYGQYYEAGAVGVRFLSQLFDGLALDVQGDSRRHIKETARLRTFLQHNLDFTRPHDRETLSSCEAWFQERCATRLPASDDDWSCSLEALMSDARELMATLVATIRDIESDEGREETIREWTFRLERHHPPSDFDAIISAAATDMGRDHLDVVRFRKRFYDRWIASLAALDGEYDFGVEGRKLVEYALLTELEASLPITGKDIMRELRVEGGPRVGELLQRGLALFTERPCPRAELLTRLAEDMSQAAGRSVDDSSQQHDRSN